MLYLAKMKKVCARLFICCKIHENVSENHSKVGKMLGENLVIFALDSKLDQATETLFLALASRFLWLVVHFDKYFYFGMKQKLCLKILFPGFGHS